MNLDVLIEAAKTGKTVLEIIDELFSDDKETLKKIKEAVTHAKDKNDNSKLDDIINN